MSGLPDSTMLLSLGTVFVCVVLFALRGLVPGLLAKVFVYPVFLVGLRTLGLLVDCLMFAQTLSERLGNAVRRR